VRALPRPPTAPVSSRSVGAGADERAAALPGDERIRDPIGSLTHAVTIRGTPGDVWPWLVQMGGGRAGWYSYDFIDNGGEPSAERIRPELQAIGVGTILPAVPGATDAFAVVRCERERALVLAVPKPDGTCLVTWALVLEALPDGRTRLLARARVARGYSFRRLPFWLIRLGHSIMQRRQLLGIAKRVEARDSRAA
jgi:hypothetical protein